MNQIAWRHSPVIHEIQKVVAKAYGLPVTVMQSERRSRKLARPRQVAMYLCERHTPRTLAQIAQAFDRDQSTVIHGVKRINELLETDPDLGEEVAYLEDEVALIIEVGPDTLKAVDTIAAKVRRRLLDLAANDPETLLEKLSALGSVPEERT